MSPFAMSVVLCYYATSNQLKKDKPMSNQKKQHDNYEWFCLGPNAWARGKTKRAAKKICRENIPASAWQDGNDVSIDTFHVKKGLSIEINLFGDLAWEGDDKDLVFIDTSPVTRPRNS